MLREKITDLLTKYEVDTLYFENLYYEHWVWKNKLIELMYNTYKNQGMQIKDAEDIVWYWFRANT